MARALPNWLAVKYFQILLSFSILPFTAEEASLALNSENITLFLHKMYLYGWLGRVGGVYRAIHPLIALMEASGYAWKSRVKCRNRLPILEPAAVRLFMNLTKLAEDYFKRVRKRIKAAEFAHPDKSYP